MPVTYDKKAKRFRDSKGRFISPKAVRREIDKLVQVSAQRLEQAAKDLANGKITIEEFQNRTRNILKASYTLSGAVAKGGWKQMSQSDWGKIGAETKKQYGYLNKFAKVIVAGITLAALLSRVKLYATGIRTVFNNSDLDAKKQAGEFTLCKRVLNARESCSQCSGWARKGFVPIDEQPKIGSLICRNFCRCFFEYQ